MEPMAKPTRPLRLPIMDLVKRTDQVGGAKLARRGGEWMGPGMGLHRVSREEIPGRLGI